MKVAWHAVLFAAAFAMAGCVASRGVTATTESPPREKKSLPRESCQPLLFSGNVEARSEIDLRKLRGATRLVGDLWIATSDVTALDDLACLEEVDGTLFLSTNANLVSVDGLKNLRRVTENLELYNNEKLDQVDFPDLTYVGGQLHINEHASLQRLDGFAALKHVGAMKIGGNSSLTKVSGFPELRTNSGHMQIVRNPQVSEVSGFGKLRSIASGLIFEHNSSLKRVVGFSRLQEVGALSITECVFETLKDFGKIRRLPQGLNLNHLHELKTLEGLSELVEVDRVIVLEALPIERYVAERFVAKVYVGPKER